MTAPCYNFSQNKWMKHGLHILISPLKNSGAGTLNLLAYRNQRTKTWCLIRTYLPGMTTTNSLNGCREPHRKMLWVPTIGYFIAIQKQITRNARRGHLTTAIQPAVRILVAVVHSWYQFDTQKHKQKQRTKVTLCPSDTTPNCGYQGYCSSVPPALLQLYSFQRLPNPSTVQQHCNPPKRI